MLMLRSGYSCKMSGAGFFLKFACFITKLNITWLNSGFLSSTFFPPVVVVSIIPKTYSCTVVQKGHRIRPTNYQTTLPEKQREKNKVLGHSTFIRVRLFCKRPQICRTQTKSNEITEILKQYYGKVSKKNWEILVEETSFWSLVLSLAFFFLNTKRLQHLTKE